MKINTDGFEKINVALKSNKLYAFLLGIGVYKMDSGNMNSDMILNTGAIMNVAYDYHVQVADISQQMQQSLEFLANIKTFDAVYSTLDLVSYQLEAEKKNVSPFVLDNKKILKILSNNIKNNLHVYTKEGDLGNYHLMNGVFPIVQKYDEMFNSQYGHKIL